MLNLYAAAWVKVVLVVLTLILFRWNVRVRRGVGSRRRMLLVHLAEWLLLMSSLRCQVIDATLSMHGLIATHLRLEVDQVLGPLLSPGCTLQLLLALIVLVVCVMILLENAFGSRLVALSV